jgi:hypothetical protein
VPKPHRGRFNLPYLIAKEEFMKGSQILEKFFEKRHQQWKKECYGILHPESRASFLSEHAKNDAEKKNNDNQVKPHLPSH